MKSGIDFSEFDDAARDLQAAEKSEQGQAPAAPQPPRVPLGDDNLQNILRTVTGTEQPPAPPRETEHERTVPYARFEEVNNRLSQMQGQLDLVAGRALRGEDSRQVPAPPYQAPMLQVPEGADDETREMYDLLNPILAQQAQTMMQQFAPVVDYVQRQMGVSHLKQNVEGFDDPMMAEVEAEYAKLSPEEKREANTRFGAEALAYRVMRRRQATQQPRLPQMNPNRAHSLGRGQGFQPPPSKEIDIWSLSDDQFEKFQEMVQARNNGTLGRDPHQPDSFLDGNF